MSSSPSATGVCAFRKKPVVIEAVQWNGYPVVFKAWMDEMGSLPFVLGHSDGTLLIQTLEDGKDGQAKHVADRGDWIIRGIKGEFYPCKPDIFAATYEEASKPSETKPSESPGVLWYKLDMAARHFDQVEDEELSEACREAQRLTLVSPSATRRSIDPVQAAIDITREVAELPDRNSPEGEPEMMLVKDSELRRIVHNVLVEALRG